MIDGKEVIDVEDLTGAMGELHPVQAAMLRHHGSQCGFCTPGIVMSLFALYHNGDDADRRTVNGTLAGNLCRRTGYRPIVDAAREACAGAADDRYSARRAATVDRLEALNDGEDMFVGDHPCDCQSSAVPGAMPGCAGDAGSDRPRHSLDAGRPMPVWSSICAVLEWRAIAGARTAAARATAENGAHTVRIIRQTHGSGLGQCCGGTVRLMLEVYDPARLPDMKADNRAIPHHIAEEASGR